MPRDYKKRAPAKRKKPAAKTGMPGWAWLSLGLAIGLFAGFLFYLSERPAPPTPSLTLPIQKPVVRSAEKAATPKPARPQGGGTETAKDAAPPKFDFYTLLPKLEVVVPTGKPQPAKPIQNAQPKPSAPPQKIEIPGSYMLQTGSFGTYAQANRMKASLALLGFVANISQVEVGLDTWYRVQIGPFHDLKKLNAVRDALSRHKIDSLALKISG
ncbi:SPOR domain-containing protein [Acidihalobacter ferrooxydans]|uniref:SPOR domain-containing protein n=1 Tax=Acidihalobacter ferrooxydans TaxID=1765967 RepID=A0A1P8UG58_9GAMM|nr:SPOR domain-containing protein [Acidihalobacter ferrooxydans]APZ42751.1 hypothetical protein BW247_06295 [Acidihalobacter ferrooxydans]